MDEAILSSVAGSIIENLSSAAFEQVGSRWNVKDGLEQIRKTVSTIKAVLQDAAEEQNHNYQDRVWLEKLKEAVFDADDLLDESKYYTELALRQKETSGSITEKGWWRSASTPDDQQRQHNQSLPSFPRLSSLEMDGSPNMTTMPLFPCLEKELSLYNVSLKPFQETILCSSSSSSFSPLSKLKHMKIWGMEDVVSLPHGWASNLISLESLCILRCKELNLGGDVDGMEWRNLNRLSYLRFESLPKLNSLPAGLQHITTLKTLIIIDCENLETLPWWIWKLISLESLTLTGCPNLKSLPNEMRNLTSLQTLKIFDCPGLWRRCEKETGQDWHKIAHITTVEIRLGYF